MRRGRRRGLGGESVVRRWMSLLILVFLSVLAARAEEEPEALSRIAFGSCADEEKPQPIWDAVLAYRPDLFIFAGDNVYGDISQGRALPDAELLDGLRDSYAKAAAVPGFARVKDTIPTLATWDDHDYGKNDAGAEFPGKQASQKLFLEFWGILPTDERHEREGIYHAAIFGPEGRRVQVILLDTRFFRSPLKRSDQPGAPGKEHYVPDEDPHKTMLGEAQWAWLDEQLRQPAELRLIVSSIQVLAEGHGFERWGNLPRERQRLFDLIRTTRANGVIILSGDRHLGALYRETKGTPYPLLEITSSGLTHSFPGSREPGPNRLGPVYGEINFGTVDIDWAAGAVTLAVRNDKGEPVRRHSVRLSELRPARP